MPEMRTATFPPNRKVPTKRRPPPAAAPPPPAMPSFRPRPLHRSHAHPALPVLATSPSGADRLSIEVSGGAAAAPRPKSHDTTHSCSRSCHAPRRYCSAASRAMSIRPRHASRRDRPARQSRACAPTPRHEACATHRDEDNRLSGMQAQQANREGDVLARVARRGLDEHASGRHTHDLGHAAPSAPPPNRCCQEPGPPLKISVPPSLRHASTPARVPPRVGTQHGARTLGRLAKPARRQHEHRGAGPAAFAAPPCRVRRRAPRCTR